MIKTLFFVLWGVAIALGASYGLNTFFQARANAPAPVDASTFETRKTKEISVPIIREGVVKGYVVIQLSYVVDLSIAKKLPVDPEPFVTDETFRYLYGDDKIDFAHLDRIDLDKLLHTLMFRVNGRTKSEVITDMGVLECNFLLNVEAKDSLPSKSIGEPRAPSKL